MLLFSVAVFLAQVLTPIIAVPTPVFTKNLFALRASSKNNLQRKNALDAQKLNVEFQTLQKTDPCNSPFSFSP